MNPYIKEILDNYYESDAYNKDLIKQLYTDEEINEFDIREWEKETGKKLGW